MRTLAVATSVAVLLIAGAMTAAASTTTTPASGGANVSADLAQNGAAPAFTALGSIVVTEASNNDFQTSGTLVLTAPNGWQFNVASAITATTGKVGGGAAEMTASVGAVTASSITINITVNGLAQKDRLTIGGIQAQATEGGSLPASGNILRTSANPGTATIVGVTNDATNFGSLSLALGALRLHVVLPGQAFTDGATVAASGINGAAASQTAGGAFNLVELVAADREFNVAATYSGAKTIAYAGAGGSPSYTTNVSFTAGHSTTILATTLRKAESLALSATSATSPAIASGQPSASFNVVAGPATKLQILLPGETAAPGTASGKTGAPSAQTVGTAIASNVRVNAVDANWNTVGSATPDVALNSSDAAAVISDDNGAAGGNLSLGAGAGASSSFTFWTGGAQTVTATDAAAVLSPGTSASVAVNKAASATALLSSQNPSTFGQSVTFTATVSGSVGTPAGTVDFKDGATVIASAVALDGSGVAGFTTSSLTAAAHTITAVYSGCATYATSTSAGVSQAVSKAGTSTALGSSLNPACAGTSVTLTATVTVVAPGAGVPTGSVNFKDGSTTIASSVALNASGVATLATSSLSAGNHNLTAVYNGSGNMSTSSSSPALAQAINAKPTATVSGSTAICPGGNASIQAALGGVGPWTVTWSDGVVQSGLVSSPASRSVSPAATTIYSVTSIVDANCSNAGNGSATVTVNALPAITGQPGAKSVCAGTIATFTVAASGTGITYQWRKDGVNLANGGHVSGATSATLSVSSAAAADMGSYDVVVSGTCPPAQISNAVSLTVNPVPVANIAAAATVCVGSTGNVASTPDAGPGASYAWSVSGGTITGGAGTPSITYTASTSGKSATLNVTVTNASGCSASGSAGITLSTGDVVIEDWTNQPVGNGTWQSATLSAKEMMYPEGGTIPYRLTLPQPCVGNSWSITLEYDFADVATGVHFCDFLTSYNAYEGSVTGKGCLGDTCVSETNFAIPSDPSCSYQLPGLFTVKNGTITSVSAYSTYLTGGVTVKQLTLTGTAMPGADVMILFGAHLARDYEWGADKGAHEWPTGTASLGFSAYSATGTSGHTNVKVSDNILDNPSESDISVVATDSPNPVNAGQDLSYRFLVSNSGPLASIKDTLSDSIPAGTKFVSASVPTGWTLTAPAAGTTGLVKWVLAAGFAAGQNFTFDMVVHVDAGAVGTVENTARLATGNVDAYQTNNTAHTSTPIGGATAGGGAGGGGGDGLNPGDPSPTAENPVLPRAKGGTPGSNPGPAAGPTPTSGSSQPGASPSAQPGGDTAPAGAANVPSEALERPSPNPFTSSMHMAYAVSGESQAVDISVYDVAGRRVSVLAQGIQSVGRHDVAWDGRDASGAHVRKGMYFVRIQIGNQARQVRVASVN